MPPSAVAPFAERLLHPQRKRKSFLCNPQSVIFRALMLRKQVNYKTRNKSYPLLGRPDPVPSRGQQACCNAGRFGRRSRSPQTRQAIRSYMGWTRVVGRIDKKVRHSNASKCYTRVSLGITSRQIEYAWHCRYSPALCEIPSGLVPPGTGPGRA